MLSVVVGFVLIVHGLITAAIWLAPAGDDAPFDVSHSWLVGEARGASAILAVAAALASIAAGIGWLAGSGAAPGLSVLAGAAGTVLMLVWFDRWLSLGLAISLAVMASGVAGLVGFPA